MFIKFVSIYKNNKNKDNSQRLKVDAYYVAY